MAKRIFPQMKKLKILIFVIIFILFCILVLRGCRNVYDIKVCNYSGSTIEVVTIEWGKLRGPFGFIPNNLYKNIITANTIEPNYFKETIIFWIDEQGNKHSKKVSVPPKPMFKHVVLIFEIRKNEHVSVYLDEDYRPSNWKYIVSAIKIASFGVLIFLFTLFGKKQNE